METNKVYRNGKLVLEHYYIYGAHVYEIPRGRGKLRAKAVFEETPRGDGKLLAEENDGASLLREVEQMLKDTDGR